MNITEVEERLKVVTYRPGVTIEAISLSDPHRVLVAGAAGVAISAMAPDSNDPTREVRVGMTESLDLVPPAAFTHLVYQLLRRFELHEVDEWFRIDGVRYCDPHPVYPVL